MNIHKNAIYLVPSAVRNTNANTKISCLCDKTNEWKASGAFGCVGVSEFLIVTGVSGRGGVSLILHVFPFVILLKYEYYSIPNRIKIIVKY